jgi:dihydroorotate dehydrogenase (fumarate)
VKCSLACSGGVHRTADVIKALMAGAHAVQMVSALLHLGAKHLRAVLTGLREWMEEHGYDSVANLRGSMNLEHCPDPAAYERANYLRVLQLWQN